MIHGRLQSFSKSAQHMSSAAHSCPFSLRQDLVAYAGPRVATDTPGKGRNTRQLAGSNPQTLSVKPLVGSTKTYVAGMETIKVNK